MGPGFYDEYPGGVVGGADVAADHVEDVDDDGAEEGFVLPDAAVEDGEGGEEDFPCDEEEEDREAAGDHGDHGGVGPAPCGVADQAEGEEDEGEGEGKEEEADDVDLAEQFPEGAQSVGDTRTLDLHGSCIDSTAGFESTGGKGQLAGLFGLVVGVEERDDDGRDEHGCDDAEHAVSPSPAVVDIGRADTGLDLGADKGQEKVRKGGHGPYKPTPLQRSQIANDDIRDQVQSSLASRRQNTPDAERSSRGRRCDDDIPDHVGSEDEDVRRLAREDIAELCDKRLRHRDNDSLCDLDGADIGLSVEGGRRIDIVRSGRGLVQGERHRDSQNADVQRDGHRMAPAEQARERLNAAHTVLLDIVGLGSGRGAFLLILSRALSLVLRIHGEDCSMNLVLGAEASKFRKIRSSSDIGGMIPEKSASS